MIPFVSRTGQGSCRGTNSSCACRQVRCCTNIPANGRITAAKRTGRCSMVASPGRDPPCYTLAASPPNPRQRAFNPRQMAKVELRERQAITAPIYRGSLQVMRRSSESWVKRLLADKPLVRLWPFGPDHAAWRRAYAMPWRRRISSIRLFDLIRDMEKP